MIDRIHEQCRRKQDVAFFLKNGVAVATVNYRYARNNDSLGVKRCLGDVQTAIQYPPHDVLLVLDASTGQNALEQAKQFTEVAPIRSLALTKLDGTAKGGVALGISDQFKIPIKYMGVGESIDKLQIFNKRAFVESLFGGKVLS